MKIKLTTFFMAAFCIAKAVAVPMGTAFTYQGRLNDGGAPATGLYDLTFTLHDDPTNVVSVGTYIILSAVPVTNGLFTVQLNTEGEFGPNAFTGQARWLQIGVRTNCHCLINFTFLEPRQGLTPTPYALFASNAVHATFADRANVASSVPWSSITGVPASLADGVDNDTTYSAGAGLSLSAANEFSVNFAGSGVSNAAARSDHGHFGAQWTGASIGNGVSVVNSSAGAGLFGQQGAGSGQVVLFGIPAGVWGESSDGYGVHGASGSPTGAGVYGLTTSSGGSSSGLFGLASATVGTNCGVRGVSMSAGGAGVYGRVKNPSTNTLRNDYLSAGVFGESQNYPGVIGLSDAQFGVEGFSSRGTAVAGFTETGNYAVYGGASKGTGVGGNSDTGDGVWGYSDEASGVHGYSFNGAGVRAMSHNGNPIEAYQDTYPETRRFYVNKLGEVYASGAFHPGGADFAEMLPSHESLEPGDVLVIGEDGKLARSTQPYQENVAGVRATKPGLLGGAEDGVDLTGKTPLAVVGVVPVKVTDENGSIKPGDKLTASSTPGHAMKARSHAEIGTVIGKALQKLDGQRGVIEMLVILQ